MGVRRISGGLHDFVDSGSHAPLSKEDQKKIEDAYERARQRKLNESRTYDVPPAFKTLSTEEKNQVYRDYQIKEKYSKDYIRRVDGEVIVGMEKKYSLAERIKKAIKRFIR